MKRTSAWSLLCVIGAMPSPILAQSELQRQIDACGSLPACNIDIPYGTHVIYSPWNLRDKASLEIRAPVGTQVIFFFLETAPPVCIDTTGTLNIVIEGVTFGLGNTSKRPDVLWLHGRPADDLSAWPIGRTVALLKSMACTSCWARSAIREPRMLHEKTIGKPYAGNPHVRFERGPQETEPARHRARGLPMNRASGTIVGGIESAYSLKGVSG